MIEEQVNPITPEVTISTYSANKRLLKHTWASYLKGTRLKREKKNWKLGQFRVKLFSQKVILFKRAVYPFNVNYIMYRKRKLPTEKLDTCIRRSSLGVFPAFKKQETPQGHWTPLFFSSSQGAKYVTVTQHTSPRCVNFKVGDLSYL